MDDLINRLVGEISSLDRNRKIRFTKELAHAIEDDPALLKELQHIFFMKSYPWAKVASWIESRLKKDMDLTPRRVAHECCHYKKLPRAMIPDLIRLTRNIKARLRMRLKRKGAPGAAVAKMRRSIRPEVKAPENDRTMEGEEFILSLSEEAKRLSSFAPEDQVRLMKMWLRSVREKDPSFAEEILFVMSNVAEDEIECNSFPPESCEAQD
jgi:hypothetical protein